MTDERELYALYFLAILIVLAMASIIVVNYEEYRSLKEEPVVECYQARVINNVFVEYIPCSTETAEIPSWAVANRTTYIPMGGKQW